MLAGPDARIDWAGLPLALAVYGGQDAIEQVIDGLQACARFARPRRKTPDGQRPEN
jgi:hypothetical protein